MTRIPTELDVSLAKHRLRGNEAWQGNGLLQFLAVTGRKDKSREWMEPLKALCERIVFAEEDGEEIELTDDEAATMDNLAEYSTAYHAAIEASLAAE